MTFSQSFRMAIKSIMGSKVRSLLTMLGIIIGVAAVIVIVGLGNGMQVYMTQSFESMGTNLIYAEVFGRGDGSTRTVDIDDMYQLVSDNPDTLAMVSPAVSVPGGAKIGNESLQTTRVSGVSEDYDKINHNDVKQGRFLQYVDVLRRQNVCVIGSYLNDTYFQGDGLGQTVKIMGVPFTVVGTLEQAADGQERSMDNALYIPYTIAGKISGQGDYTSYSFSARSEDTVLAGQAVIQSKLAEVFGSTDYFYVYSMTEMMDQMNSMLSIMITILTAIAAISLVVGGIGIMNIMLVSVTERTREIGIRKALGAKRRHIMRQFIIEAATTSAIGGVLGILAGYGLSALATKAIVMGLGQQMAVAPTINSVMVAFGISAGIGVLFGCLPARKAAKLNPIDALRYD